MTDWDSTRHLLKRPAPQEKYSYCREDGVPPARFVPYVRLCLFFRLLDADAI
jgi:hypothetical protein